MSFLNPSWKLNMTSHHKGDYVILVPNAYDDRIKELFEQYGVSQDSFQYMQNNPEIDRTYDTQGVPDFAAAFPLFMERQPK